MTTPAFRYAPNPAGCACRHPARSWSPRCAVCGRFYELRPVLVLVDYEHEIVRFPAAAPMAVTVLVAHRFADGQRGARFYLPEGEEPTSEHARDLDRALRGDR